MNQYRHFTFGKAIGDGIHDTSMKSLFKIGTGKEFCTKFLKCFLELLDTDAIDEFHIQLTQVDEGASCQLLFCFSNISIVR